MQTSEIKNKYSKFSLLIVGAVGVALLFNNCAEAVFSSTGAKLAPPDVIKNVIDSCNKAEAAGQLVTAQQKIVLDDTGVESGRPGNICQFGVDDNLTMKEGELRARYTQTRSLSLPAGAVLCDVDMNSQVQNFRYDDVFFLSFNGHLLATNDKTASDRLSAQNLFLPISKRSISVYEYDWLKVRTAPFQNQNRDDYCIGLVDGLSNCAWPLTEQSGKIQLDFSQEALVAMSAGQPTQTLQFAITGDNNPDIDCYHQRLELDATVKYFIPAAQ